MRYTGFLALAFALAFGLVAAHGQTCSPPGTPTCDPNGNPVVPSPRPPSPTPDPGPTPNPTPDPSPAPDAPTSVETISAVTGTVTLGGGRAVAGAEGIALDPTTGLVYIGLNGAIISGCEGDGTTTPGPGAGQLSVVNPSQAREIAAVRTGQAPIWPTVHPARGLVYMMGSGGTGTINVHSASDGTLIRTITVGGRPHMGGLDLSTGLMVVGNTVRSSNTVAEQNHATIVNMTTNSIVREFETSPAPHGMAVDQERHIGYFSAVGDGAIVAVNTETGQTLFSRVPKSAYGSAFGGNNMLARQAATRRLFQVNTQMGFTGIIVVDEVTLAAEKVISFGSTSPVPWGMWVDEPNRLLFAALPNSNAIGVVDLDSLTHVASIPVGTCPYAVTIDPVRNIGVTSNQGSPRENATASILNMCPVYRSLGRIAAGCSALDVFKRRRF